LKPAFHPVGVAGIQSLRLQCVMSYNPRLPFAEDALHAEAVPAAEAARVQFQPDCDPVPRKIGNAADVAAVDAS
jgi:hypothetical protein